MFSLPFRIAEYIGRKKRNGMTLFAYAFYTLFCLSRYMPIRQICEDYRVTVSAMGLIAYVLNDRWTQFIFMLCWFYLIGDGPFLIVLFNMCYCEAAVSSGQRASFCSFY